MEIKIKIPTYFAKYRVVKLDDRYLAQVKQDGIWRTLDKNNPHESWTVPEYTVTKGGVSNLDEAIALINRVKQTIVWEGR